MDPLIAAAARLLAAGDPVAALGRIALRDDAAALALRGIAMAQLGELLRAKALLRRAARAFGAREVVARARCAVAEAEIALASRDLAWPVAALDAARATLEHHGDRLNAAHARTLVARRLLLIGRLDDAERVIEAPDLAQLPPALQAVHELVAAGVAIRRERAAPARAALARSEAAARVAGIPALQAEVEAASRALDAPVARLVTAGAVTTLGGVAAAGVDEPLTLAEVEALLDSPALVVDARRHLVRQRGLHVSLATRPVLFVLLRGLAEAWPRDVPRGELIARAFRARIFDESHRARLRVEIGRLRAAVRTLAEIRASDRGFTLVPRRAPQVAVIAPPVESKQTALLGLLGDGEAWSTSALALALGAGQRSVQRALEALVHAGLVQALGRARARRWVAAPVPAFASPLLLPAVLPDA